MDSEFDESALESNPPTDDNTTVGAVLYGVLEVVT